MSAVSRMLASPDISPSSPLKNGPNCYKLGEHGYLSTCHCYTHLYERVHDHSIHIPQLSYNTDLVQSVMFLRMSEVWVLVREFRGKHPPASIDFLNVAVLV